MPIECDDSANSARTQANHRKADLSSHQLNKSGFENKPIIIEDRKIDKA